MEAAIVNAVILIATVAAAIKFVLVEWEAILEAWTRVKAKSRRR